MRASKLFLSCAIASVSIAGAATAMRCDAAFAEPAIYQPDAEPGDKSNIPIKHVIIIMQENRSFDTYFGTFPGAHGLPSGICIPLNPAKPSEGCVAPFHDVHDINSGGPHQGANAQADADDGITTQKLDGFIYEQTTGLASECQSKEISKPASNCALFVPGANRHDVMGYHTQDEIPNYWAYAQNFVLQDEMFEGVRGWSVAAHLDLTSEWSARCSTPGVLSTCTSSVYSEEPSGTKILYPWVSLFQLMDIHHVSWKYYLGAGLEPDCQDDKMTCDPEVQSSGVASLWNPAPGFAWVEAKGPSYIARHNPDADQFLLDVANGTLPQVSWVVPSQTFSEHPPAGITVGMEYVTSLINAVMQSPYWANTAIFLAWDDWGGFYDHVVPPIVDMNNTKTPVQGFGFRVPGLLISAYAKQGFIDHRVLSPDSYARLIENLFMHRKRLDPVEMNQPDNRPDIRDELTSVTFPDGTVANIGELIDEFDFKQTPLPPLVLSTHIPSEIWITCGSTDSNNPQICGKTTVQINWKHVNGPEVPGPFTYQVLRDGQPLGSCHTVKTQCYDKTAAAGAHYYTAYSIDPNGVASPASAAAEADVP